MPVDRLWSGARPPTDGPFTLNEDSPQARGLVGWWPVMAADGAGYIPELARSGPRAVFTGSPTRAFDSTLGYGVGGFSTANYIDAGNPNVLRDVPSGGALSVSAWVVRAAPGGTNSTVVSKSNAGGNGWILRQESSPGAFKFSVIRATSNSEFTTTSAFANGPHLFVGVYSGVQPIIYVDGESVAGSGTAGSGTYTVDTNDSINIGRLGQGGGFWPFLGSIYDVRVYNVALTPAVINQMYNAATRWDLYRPERRRLWAITTVAPTTAYKDAGVRVRVGIGNNRDATVRVRAAIRAFRDASTRVYAAIRNYRDATTRIRTAIRAFTDATARVAVASAANQAFKDAVARIRLRLGQASRPSGDVSIGGWTTNTGATTNLYQAVDEATRDDADYIQSAAGPSNDTVILNLSPIADPGVDDGVRVRIALGKDVAGGATIGLVATLQAGTTDIASGTFSDISDVLTEVSFALTTAEVQSFRSNGGFANPRIKLVANQT